MIIPKEIVDFSVEYICKLFETNEDKRGVSHEKTTLGGEKALIEHFNFSLDGKSGEDTYCLGRLFLPAYWVFLEDYAFRDEGFPNGGGVHYWRLRDGVPDRDEFKNKILGGYKSYLEANLEKIQSSS